MDNPCPLILDISSDEDSGFADSREGDFTGDAGGFFMREDHDWLSKLLREVDGDNEDDSDEVLLVSEVISNPKRPRLQSSKPACEIVCNGGGEDDDDCVILDCEPDRARVVKTVGVDNNGGGDDSEDSNDLEIVGEKGEVACRDFPHARHLCANFSFASTPHDVHCSQCHCYVCDSIAPCAHWGTGISSSDHCHANDKEDYWKTKRKMAKMGGQPVPALPGTIDAFFSAGAPQMSQVPPLCNSLLQNQAFRHVPCRPSKPSHVNVPIAINQNRGHLAGRVIPRSKTHPRYYHQRLHTTWRSDTASTDNNSNPVNIGPQLIHRPALKRPGIFKHITNSRNGYHKRYYRSQVSRGFSLKRCPGLNNGSSSNHQQHTGHCAANPVLPRPNFSVPQSMDTGSMNYIPSQLQVHFQPNSSYAVGGPMHSLPDMTSQPYVGDNFEDEVPYHSQALLQPNLEVLADTVNPPQLNNIAQPNFPIPSQSLLAKQLHSSHEYGKLMHSTTVIPSPPNQSSQFEGFFDHTSLHINHQNTYDLSGQAHSVVHTSHAEFGVNWDTSLSHNNVQSATSADNFSTTCSTVPANSFYPESVPPANGRHSGAVTDSHFPVSQDPNPLNFGHDNWITENQPFLGNLEMSPMSPGLSVFSPESASID